MNYGQLFESDSTQFIPILSCWGCHAVYHEISSRAPNAQAAPQESHQPLRNSWRKMRERAKIRCQITQRCINPSFLMERRPVPLLIVVSASSHNVWGNAHIKYINTIVFTNLNLGFTFRLADVGCYCYWFLGASGSPWSPSCPSLEPALGTSRWRWWLDHHPILRTAGAAPIDHRNRSKPQLRAQLISFLPGVFLDLPLLST